MAIQVDSQGEAITITPEEFKRLWVHELRHSDRVQGQGALHVTGPRGVDEYCCLGVACDLAHKYGIVDRHYDEAEGRYFYGKERNAMTFPVEVTKFLGIRISNPEVSVPIEELYPDDYWDIETPETEIRDVADLNDSHEFDFEKLSYLIDEQVEVK